MIFVPWPALSGALLACVAPATPSATETPVFQESEPAAADVLELMSPAAVESALRQLAVRFEDATLHELGGTREGRPLLALQLNSSADHKPALLLASGVDAEFRCGPTYVIEHATQLLGGDRPHELLAAYTVYCVPVANPDGLARAFGDLRREPVTQGRGIDNDRDARTGENDVSDLDDNGSITWMRVPDPAGKWIADPHDERAQVEADALLGQVGAFRLEPEGLDSDGDEAVGEDPVEDTRFNRNFPANWDELAPDAGRFPTDEPAVQHLCDFVIARPELTTALVIGAQDNLVKTPSAAGSGGRVPKPGVLKDDREWLARWGERFRESAPSGQRQSADAAGSFQAWLYEHRGIWTLNIKPWQLPEEAPKVEEPQETEAETTSDSEGTSEAVATDEAPEEPAAEEAPAPPGDPSTLAQQLEWIDAMGPAEAWRFAPWRSFEHPQLGSVEIGGLTPFAEVEAPAAERQGLAEAQFELLISLAQDPARISIASATAQVLGEGLVRVEAAVVNNGGLPLLSAATRRARIQRPARLDLQLPEGALLLSGSPMELIRDLAPAGGRTEFTWLVRTDRPEDLELALTSQHAGAASLTPEVTR